MKNTGVKLSSLSNRKNRDKYDELTKNNIEFNNNSTKNIEIKKETQELRPKSKVKSENYIHIPGWAVCELGLKGNELLIYAIIFGFSQEENQTFKGSQRYLADWTNSTTRSVRENLKSLVKKGFIGKIERFENGVKFCEYYATRLRTTQKEDAHQFSLGGKKVPGGGEKFSPNILENNLGTNSINRISKVSKKEQLEQDKNSPENKKNNSGFISEKKETKNKKLKPSKPKKAKSKPISFDAIIDTYTESEDLRKELKEHLKTRKQKKAALTNRAIELSLKKLDSLADSDEEKLLIVQNSIMNGWVGFFELNEKDKNKLNNHSSYNLNEYVKAMDTFENKSEDDEEFVDEKELEEERRKDLLFEGYEEIAPGVFYDKIFQRTEFLNEESRIAYEKNSGDSP